MPTPVENTPLTTAFNNLPNEIVLKIADPLSLIDKARLSSVSKYYYNLFKPELEAAKASRLLHFVAHGEQAKADALLEQYPELLLRRSNVTDYSGRTFRHILAYEYAYWAKDTYMCRMLEVHMDDATRAIMLVCCETLERNGLRYEKQGIVEEHSTHFDFSPLKVALARYAESYDQWRVTNNLAAMTSAWIDIGLAQRDVPVHVMNEYCHPGRSFYPRPEFNERTLPRHLTFFNYNTVKYELFFPLVALDPSGVNAGLALIQGKRPDLRVTPSAPRIKGWGAVGSEILLDFTAVSHLDDVRTAELAESRENLLPRDGLDDRSEADQAQSDTNMTSLV